MFTSLISVIDVLSKKATEVVVQPRPTQPRPKRQRNNNTENRSGTVTFDDMPVYLLLDECAEYRTASNGNKFIIRMIEVPEHGLLPVPVWENDNRSEEKLKTRHIKI